MTSRIGNIGNLAQNMGYQPQQQQQITPRGPGGLSGGGGGGGRGGGGGGGAPQFSQEMLDWATSLLAQGKPGQVAANTLDLPDYKGMAMRAFDPSMWNNARGRLGEAYGQDTATAQRSTADMANFLNSNYRNAFAGGPQTTMANAPGMNAQAMGRMLQGQGVNAYENAGYQQTLNEGRQSDAGLSSLFAALAGNEDIMQRNRLAGAQQYGLQATDALTAAKRAGELGLDLGQGQAQSAWQTAADERAYQDYQQQQQVLQQEAMQNWQRQNQVQDVNAQNTNSYMNSTMQALLGLLPQIQGSPGLSLPSLASLGLSADGSMNAQLSGQTPNPDPLNWAAIRAALDAQGGG